jgi:putative NADPH-quinone reductase
MSVLAILGSARGESHTAALLEIVLGGRGATRIDLRDLDIRHYEYDRPLEGDGFASVAEAMVAHNAILFATPVYWYSMSGRMKILFDRLTDVVTVRKDLGRKLAGRSVFVVACGAEEFLPEGFEVPFRDTAGYLDMRYGGAFYAQTANGPVFSEEIRARAVEFAARIFAIRT